MKKVDSRVANLMASEAKVPSGKERTASINSSLRKLTLTLQRAEKVMSAYIGRNFFIRSILSSSDQKNFYELQEDIKDIMQVGNVT